VVARGSRVLGGTAEPTRLPRRAFSVESGRSPNWPATPGECILGCSAPTPPRCVVLGCQEPCPSRGVLLQRSRLARGSHAPAKFRFLPLLRRSSIGRPQSLARRGTGGRGTWVACDGHPRLGSSSGHWGGFRPKPPPSAPTSYPLRPPIAQVPKPPPSAPTSCSMTGFGRDIRHLHSCGECSALRAHLGPKNPIPTGIAETPPPVPRRAAR